VLISVGLVHAVVTISASSAEHLGLIPGLDSFTIGDDSLSHIFLMLEMIISVSWQ